MACVNSRVPALSLLWGTMADSGAGQLCNTCGNLTQLRRLPDLARCQAMREYIMIKKSATHQAT